MRMPQAERVAVIARLRPGAHQQAAEIVAEGPPYPLSLSGLRRHSVFLGEHEVIFVFEGPSVERLVRLLVNDPAASSGFGRWGPLLDGTPSLLREAFYWEK